jgi:hypothetical protein
VVQSDGRYVKDTDIGETLVEQVVDETGRTGADIDYRSSFVDARFAN